jgi:epoxyqueuosine reductase
MSRALPKPFLNSEAGRAPDPLACLTSEVARARALEAGFTDAGLVALPHAHQERDAARFEEWVRAGRSGSMRYLERRASTPQGESAESASPRDEPLLRSRVGIPFPWARSVVVGWANYNSPQPRSIDPAPEGAGWIARYAWSGKTVPGRKEAGPLQQPSDYHKVLLKRMKAVEAGLRAQFGAFQARAFVDTGPVVERALAVAAGLGWTGKNTCLIHPRLGSNGFLAVLVTSLEIRGETASPAQRALTVLPDRCGSCRRCLDACPTGALIAPYQMDATRCIAYLTIEHRGPAAPGWMDGIGRQVFGCDICQDVCPWNRKAPFGADPMRADPELEARPELVNPALDWLAAMDEAEFEAEFNGSPVRRTGFLGLKRNLAIAMGNSGLDRFTPRLELWAGAADEGLSTAARWALDRLRGH